MSRWLITHWTDEVISHTKPDVTSYFQIYSMLTHIIRICSDVLIITGLWRVIIRYDFLRPLKVDLFADTLFSSVLWVLAGCHIILLIVTTGTWLGDVDLDKVNSIARARSAIEVTYMAVQFCAMCVMSIYACSRASERKTGCPYYNVRTSLLCMFEEES